MAEFDGVNDIPHGATVTMGGKQLVFGDSIEQMRDSNDILGDIKALRSRIAENGYLLLRGFYDRDRIISARQEILTYMAENGFLAPETKQSDGMIGPDNKATIFRHHVIHQHFPTFLSIVNSDRINTLFQQLLDGEVLSLDHKWLRAVGHGHHTNAHYDVVYMGEGTKQLYTTWTSFGDIPLEMGPLAVCLDSHRLDHLKATYGASDAHDELQTGWFSDNPHEVADTLGVRWASTEFQMGDIVIFGMYFMHASLDNVSNRYRLSSDTRYQLATEPVDRRHMGKEPDVIPKAENRKTMTQAREEWGI